MAAFDRAAYRSSVSRLLVRQFFGSPDFPGYQHVSPASGAYCRRYPLFCNIHLHVKNLEF
jgi:hypothetical protein